MRRATERLPAGSWPPERAIASITLAFDDRHRRRRRLVDDMGEPFLLDLDRAAVLGDGDGLVLGGGGVIRVRAADEAVMEVRGATAADTARLAWHVGNRHVAVQVLADGTLRLRSDHVLADMLGRLGVRPFERLAPFTPEPGAYVPPHDDHDPP